MKWILRGLGVVVLLVVSLLGWLTLRSPAMRAAPTEKIEASPARLARGDYLVHHVVDCLHCHSDFQLDKFGFPEKPGSEGQGGFVFDKVYGVPGTVCAQNITQDPETGLGAWTDGEILRAFREGVSRDGKTLFPMMPYQNYRSMSDEDAKSIVVFLRTLPAVKHSVPRQNIDFPINLFIKFAPKPIEAAVVAPDDKTDHLGYGRYLVTIAGCHDCHTAHDDKGGMVPGRDYAGGWEMQLPCADGPKTRVVTANITPDPDAYLGKATKPEFIARFKSFAELGGDKAPKVARGRNTIMPWAGMGGMTEADLGAIYDYLRTLPPIKNAVVSFPDAPPA